MIMPMTIDRIIPALFNFLMLFIVRSLKWMVEMETDYSDPLSGDEPGNVVTDHSSFALMPVTC
jgi:hypothetical protein